MDTLAQALSGGLRRGAGYATPGGSQRVRTLQRRLQAEGLSPGPVDGRYGPKTEAAVARLQHAVSLSASGAVDSRTRRILARGLGRRGNERPVAIEPLRPPSPLRGMVAVPLATPAADASLGIELWLAGLIAAAALLLGALCSAAAMRARARATGPAEPPYRLSPDPPEQLVPAGEGPELDQDEADLISGPPESVKAVGYVSVPKANGEDTGALEAQAAAIDRFCERRGWELLHVVRDVENGHPKGLERPGLLYALERIAEGEASCLVVSELERLSRSAADLGRIVEWIDERDARLVAIDLRLDTGSAQGRLTAPR